MYELNDMFTVQCCVVLCSVVQIIVCPFSFDHCFFLTYRLLSEHQYCENLTKHVCNYSNMMSATNGAGTAFPSVAHEFTSGFQWGSCCSIFSFLCSVLQIIVCPSLIYGFRILLWYLQTFLSLGESGHHHQIIKLLLVFAMIF